MGDFACEALTVAIRRAMPRWPPSTTLGRAEAVVALRLARVVARAAAKRRGDLAARRSSMPPPNADGGGRYAGCRSGGAEAHALPGDLAHRESGHRPRCHEHEPRGGGHADDQRYGPTSCSEGVRDRSRLDRRMLEPCPSSLLGCRRFKLPEGRLPLGRCRFQRLCLRVIQAEEVVRGMDRIWSFSPGPPSAHADSPRA